MENIKSTDNSFGWQFWLWLGSTVLVVLIVVVTSVAWLTRHAVMAGPRLTEAQSQIILEVAAFPAKVRVAGLELYQLIDDDPVALLMDKQVTEQPSWVRRFPAPEDSGYLLFSGVDATAKQSVVKLLRIADGVEMARWQPDLLAINNFITDKKWQPKGAWIQLSLVHPILLKNGDIIFNTGGSLVRQNRCRAKPVWVLDEIAHHSNELDEHGESVWAPSVSEEGFPENKWLKNHIRDDALGHFSLAGKLLERRSFASILIDNGLGALLLGTSGMADNDDPIHINQIKVAHSDSRYWQRGDLLISTRHLSTLFLYRPSTNKILWHQTGPWMNQHSVDFIDAQRISVFSNNVVSGAPNKEHSFLKKNDINRVYVFDFETNQVSQPYEKLLAEAKPMTLTEGRAQLLPDGGLFIEETNYGRQLRFTKDKLLWSRVNDYDDKRIGAVSWSRYLTAEEASEPLKALAAMQCN